jgi:RNA polymerase sigma factor (sigma-70 family)
MQGMDGLELQQALAQGGAQIPIIFISGYGDIPTSVQAMKAGALDFVEKPLSIEALIARIREALAEDESRRRQYALNQEVCARYRSLTAREREVMSMVIAGRSNKEIARSLEISRRTVENHRARVMATMQAENVAQLCQMAALCP